MSEPELFLNGRIALHAGDCLTVLKALADNSIDAVVTDPPYHLTSIVKRFGSENAAPAQFGTDGAFARASRGFMGKTWDGGDIAQNPSLWSEVLRVLKPGGHLAAFGGDRTYHRMACAIDDAGFEVRRMIGWVYGQGFPKSLNISKAIDKAAGAEREVVGVHHRHGGGSAVSCSMSGPLGTDSAIPLTAPQLTPPVNGKDGGHNVKPALEPICLARKPLSEKTVAANILRWGVGGLNIDACRVPTEDKLGGGMVSMGRPKASEGWDRPWMHDQEVTERKKVESAAKVAAAKTLGRWPANLAHDGSQEILDLFPESKGQQGDVRGDEPSECHSGVYSGPKDPTAIRQA